MDHQFKRWVVSNSSNGAKSVELFDPNDVSDFAHVIISSFMTYKDLNDKTTTITQMDVYANSASQAYNLFNDYMNYKLPFKRRKYE